MNTNTKTIARKTGLTVREVNTTARDLGIEMDYRSDLRHWVILDSREADRFLDMLLEA